MALRASRCSALCTYAARTLLRSGGSFAAPPYRVTTDPTPPGATGHCPESMPADFSFRIIPHQTQRPVGGVFTHWLVRIMVAGKHQIQMAGKFLYLFQNGNRPAGERHDMRSTHFCATTGKPHFVDGLAGGGMVQILCLKSISLQRAKRSSLERMNRCSVSTTASRVSSRPC